MTRTVTGLRRDQVTYGPGRVEHLASAVTPLAPRRILLVTGRGSFESSGADTCLPGLRELAAVERWSEFAANTDSADLVVGLEIVRDFDPDLIIGIGGGSPMDMAKLLIAYDRTNPHEVLDAIRSGDKIEQRSRKLVLVPTTSGSGSEATHFAVVYIGDEKFSIAGPAMRPDHVVLDPLLALSGSSHQRATSGIDALCQSIESLWAVAATDESRRYARHALSLVSHNIRPFVHEPDERSARAMCIGSHLAGRAIDISKTTAAHALSYAITKKYGIPHGNAVALTLGAFLDLLREQANCHETHGARPDRLGAIATVSDGLRLEQKDCAGQQHIDDLLGALGLARHVVASDTVAESAADLVRTVNQQRLGNFPAQLDATTLHRIAETVFVPEGRTREPGE